MEPLYGVLDMLVLRTLLFGPLHGYAIAGAIRDRSGEVLQIEFGSLYPALKRLELQWLDRLQVGDVRAQPARQGLPADAGRSQTPPARAIRVGRVRERRREDDETRPRGG